MMLSKTKKRRQKSIVDVEVQGAVLRKVAVHWMLFFVGNAVALLMWVKMFDMPDQPWSEVGLESTERFFPFLLVSFVMLPAFIWDTVKLTTRFAGPIHRLGSALKQVAAGEKIRPIKFRHGDYWNEIASNFNRVIGAVDSGQSTNASAPRNAK